MTTVEADIEVVCPGMLEVLSIGKGDLKLSFDPEDADDTAKARVVIEEMLRKGYSIFVETDVGPARVQRFSPERMAYVITELAPGIEPTTGPTDDDGILDAEVVPDSPELAPGPTVAEQTGVGPPEDASVPPKRPRGRPKKTVDKDVPLAGSKATAVGRTAGG
jgi:hypothetical protein